MLSAPTALTTSVAGTVPESTRAMEWMGAVWAARPCRSRASSSCRSKVTAATATLGCMSVFRSGVGVARNTGVRFTGGFGVRFFLCHRDFAEPQDAGDVLTEPVEADRPVADHAED